MYLVSTYLSHRLLQFILFFCTFASNANLLFCYSFVTFYFLLYLYFVIIIHYFLNLVNQHHSQSTLKIHDSRTFYHVYLQLSKARRGITNGSLALSNVFPRRSVLRNNDSGSRVLQVRYFPAAFKAARKPTTRYILLGRDALVSTALFPASERFCSQRNGTCFGTWPQINVSVSCTFHLSIQIIVSPLSFLRIYHAAILSEMDKIGQISLISSN